ncbi:unnamed protein product [Fusarium graminearum]|nr:unnamed protein product [Fusarium graminearum]VTO93884.1 unnamed protein product [Fusarium graminearum]
MWDRVSHGISAQKTLHLVPPQSLGLVVSWQRYLSATISALQKDRRSGLEQHCRRFKFRALMAMSNEINASYSNETNAVNVGS